MEMDLLEKLAKTIKTKKRHQYYDRTVELAKQYKAILTNEDTDQFFKRLEIRESEEAFKQRKRITNNILMPLANKILAPLQKVARSNDLHSIISYSNDTNGIKKSELEAILKKYYGNKSLEQYQRGRFMRLIDIDPNAWIVTEWETVESDSDERVTPYAFEVYSREAIDFEYEHNILEYLIINIKDDNKEKYIIYGQNQTAIFKQIKREDLPFNVIPTNNAKPTVFENYYFYQIDGVFYEAYLNVPHKLGKVPAMRTGYISDPYTNEQTYINIFHTGLPYFMDTVKAKSEKDLTFALHTFPIRLQYENTCPHCNKGVSIEGTTCVHCHGTGTLVPTSTQETLTMPMPRHKDDLLPLDQLITFIRPPSDIIDTMISNIKDIEISAWNAVWGTETTSLSDVAKSVTATEMNITQDSKYDKLFSCAEHLCEFWNFNVDIITKVTNTASDLSFFMSVGKEFSIKSTYELTAEFKIQKENGMSSDVYRKTEREIIRIQYSNEPYYVRKYDVKVRFKPFSDKTADQINIILSDKTETTLQDRVLWKNYDQIFDNLEMNNEQLYDKSFKEIKSLIIAEVDRLIVEIKSQETTTPNLAF